MILFIYSESTLLTLAQQDRIAAYQVALGGLRRTSAESVRDDDADGHDAAGSSKNTRLNAGANRGVNLNSPEAVEDPQTNMKYGSPPPESNTPTVTSAQIPITRPYQVTTATM